MAGKGPDALTETELNAAVYRYFQDSGFVHTAFNFFFEAGLGNASIEEMKIPPGALIRIVQKGLRYIELEANVQNDDDYHLFDTLDLMTNDPDELKRKITSSAKPSSVENYKEQRTGSVETDKVQKIDAAETTATHRKQSTGKGKAAQNKKSGETATICRDPSMRQAKAQGIDTKKQNISSAETAKKTDSSETTTRHKWGVEWIGKKLRLKRRRSG